MTSLVTAANRIKDHYWSLIKSRQTFLLALTGTAGYLCQPPAPMDWPRFWSLAGSLSVTISGCTVLNMVFDRDIDRQMMRTRQRPLAAGQVDPRSAAILGGSLIALGLAWSLALSTLYFTLVLAGSAVDVLVYTLWLKRRTAWSIWWGGLSGGMPILAGRALAASRIETAGLILALAVVCWIPSHNLTLSELYADDYRQAGVPTFLSVYGLTATRLAVALSSLLSVLLMEAGFAWLGLPLLELAALGIVGLGLLGLALYAWRRPSRNAIAVQFKYSTLYMLVAMLLLLVAGLF